MSGVSDGVKAGSAFGPWGAAVGGAAGLASDLAGGGLVGGASSASAYGHTLDGSGWVVNMGGTQVASSSPSKVQSDPMSAAMAAVPQVAAASMGGMVPMLMLAGFALLILRKRKHG